MRRPRRARAAPPATTPAPRPTSIDSERRQFFRRFAGELLTSAAQVVGVVTELRDRSAAEASVLMSQRGSDGPAGATRLPRGNELPTGPAPVEPAPLAPIEAPTGFRTPFRFESDDVLLVIDQRQLPDALVEMPVRSASDAANAIRD